MEELSPRVAVVAVARWLEAVQVQFVTHAWLDGAREKGLYHRFDLVLPAVGTVVEIDSCRSAGHGCQPCYSSSERLTEQHLRARECDRIARQLGWRVVRMWECEALKDPGRVARGNNGPTESGDDGAAGADDH